MIIGLDQLTGRHPAHACHVLASLLLQLLAKALQNPKKIGVALFGRESRRLTEPIPELWQAVLQETVDILGHNQILPGADQFKHPVAGKSFGVKLVGQNHVDVEKILEQRGNHPLIGGYALFAKVDDVVIILSGCLLLYPLQVVFAEQSIGLLHGQGRLMLVGALRQGKKLFNPGQHGTAAKPPLPWQQTRDATGGRTEGGMHPKPVTGLLKGRAMRQLVHPAHDLLHVLMTGLMFEDFQHHVPAMIGDQPGGDLEGVKPGRPGPGLILIIHDLKKRRPQRHPVKPAEMLIFINQLLAPRLALHRLL